MSTLNWFLFGSALVLIIAAVVISKWRTTRRTRLRRGPRLTTPPAGTAPATTPPVTLAWVPTPASLWEKAVAYPKIAAVTLFVLVLYLLAVTLHPELRDRLLTREGAALLFLALIGFITFVVIKEVFWADSKVTAIIMFVLLILVLDTAIMKVVDPSGTLRDSVAMWWNTSRTAPPPVVTSARCSRQPQTVTYGAGVTSINTPYCQLRAYVVDGCAAWLDVHGRRVAYSCKGPMPSVDGIVSIAANGRAVVRINHCEPWTPGNNVDTCS